MTGDATIPDAAARPRDGHEAYSSRAEFVYRTILNDIKAGRLAPGERLREVELADRLAVSRTPIREAIRRLAENGLVSHGTGGGLAVAVLDLAQMKELYDVRAVLEGAAAGFAAQHASGDDVERMRILAERCRDASTSEEAAACNEDLHRILHAASHNRYLTMLQAQFSNWLALLSGTTFSRPGRGATAYQEHCRIIDAIAARDGQAAQDAAIAHIRSAYRIRIG
ncbi:GntR family transcriptional regulator [Microbaculum marinum]|uniref:GntR family transcriptional regulator n=1 Tax=Microbaculum marinum TaxID=1764581 RepID=A0AAW9RCR4_9HYPH